MAHNILVVDDEEGIRKYVARELTRQGFAVTTADGGRAGIEELRRRRFDAVLCDIQMPEVDGLDVLRSTADLRPRPPFVVFTAYGSVSVAVEAMKHGAADFLEKPVNGDELGATLRSHIGRREKKEKVRAKRSTEPEIVGSREWVETFMHTVRRIASAHSTVLIEGETGTGKTAVAREIWKASQRADGPFVSRNCANFQESLLESELFGHKRGSFTSADRDRDGAVREADGGTLFLDEIGELRPGLQAKLLTFLQERTYRPLGADQDLQSDVRVIAATNRNMEEDVEKGVFRADLYYRLNVLSLHIPPLRERPADVPILVDHFLARFQETGGERPPAFSAEAMQLMMQYEWKGNVRELENFVERMTVMYPGERVVPEMLFDRIRRAAGIEARPRTTSVAALPGTSSVKDELEFHLRQRIEEALRAAGGNRTRAAKMLGMNRTTMLERMKRLGFPPPNAIPVPPEDDDAEN